MFRNYYHTHSSPRCERGSVNNNEMIIPHNRGASPENPENLLPRPRKTVRFAIPRPDNEVKSLKKAKMRGALCANCSSRQNLQIVERDPDEESSKRADPPHKQMTATPH
ncbi:unnamed protein product [Cochlearia groenlandica]